MAWRHHDVRHINFEIASIIIIIRIFEAEAAQCYSREDPFCLSSVISSIGTLHLYETEPRKNKKTRGVLSGGRGSLLWDLEEERGGAMVNSWRWGASDVLVLAWVLLGLSASLSQCANDVMTNHWYVELHDGVGPQMAAQVAKRTGFSYVSPVSKIQLKIPHKPPLDIPHMDD